MVTYESNSNKLEEWSTLQPNWDSYGAEQIARAARVSGKILCLQSREYQPDIFPLPCGGVQLEWRTEDKHLTVEIGPEGYYQGVLFSFRSPYCGEIFIEHEKCQNDLVDGYFRNMFGVGFDTHYKMSLLFPLPSECIGVK
jgi:hypothetical protein